MDKTRLLLLFSLQALLLISAFTQTDAAPWGGRHFWHSVVKPAAKRAGNHILKGFQDHFLGGDGQHEIKKMEKA